MIERVRDDLYKALDDEDDKGTILKLSKRLDRLIVSFMLKNESNNLVEHR